MKYQKFSRPSGQRVFHEENFVPRFFIYAENGKKMEHIS